MRHACLIACALASCGRDTAVSPDATDAPPAPDAHVPPNGKVPMFIAQGQLGRTMVSCDDGMTWVGNHSWDKDGDPMMCGMVQDVKCGDPVCSYEVAGACVQKQCCDDTPDIPEGIAFGDTAIVGAWGHGMPGALRTTTDGLTWQTTQTSYAFSIAYGGGRFVAAGNSRTYWSTDGMTWTRGGDARFSTMGSPVRSFGYAAYDTGRFVAISAGNGRDILISSDGGDTWWRPSEIPPTCAIQVGGNG